MPLLDWVFSIILSVSLIVGAWRGLIYEVLSLLGWIIAFVAAQWWALEAAAWVPGIGTWNSTYQYVAGFVLVFVATLFACGLLAWLVKKMLEAIGLRPIDRVLGALFGVLRGVVVSLAFVVLGLLTPLHASEVWKQSYGAMLYTSLLEALRPALPQAFAKYLP